MRIQKQFRSDDYRDVVNYSIIRITPNALSFFPFSCFSFLLLKPKPIPVLLCLKLLDFLSATTTKHFFFSFLRRLALKKNFNRVFRRLFIFKIAKSEYQLFREEKNYMYIYCGLFKGESRLCGRSVNDSERCDIYAIGMLSVCVSIFRSLRLTVRTA